MPPPESNASPPSHRLLIGLAFLAFISLGLPDGLVGVAWPSIREFYGLPLKDLGHLLFCGMAGYLISSSLTGQLLHHLRLGGLLVLSSACVTTSLFGYAASFPWPCVLAFAFLGGLGAGAIDAAMNLFAATHFSARIMNWLHACWGIGATSGPVLVTAVLSAGAPWQWAYAGAGSVIGLLSILFAVTRNWWQIKLTSSTHETASSSMLAAICQRRVALQVLFFFLYTGTESTAGQLMFTLLRESRGFDLSTAGLTAAAYWGSIMVGRVGFGHATSHFSAGRILQWGTTLAMLGAVLLGLPGPPWVAVLGSLGMGLGLAPIFPTYMSLTPSRVGTEFAAHAVSFQVAAASAGIMVFPWLVAGLAEEYGLEVIARSLIVATLTLLCLHRMLQR